MPQPLAIKLWLLLLFCAVARGVLAGCKKFWEAGCAAVVLCEACQRGQHVEGGCGGAQALPDLHIYMMLASICVMCCAGCTD